MVHGVLLATNFFGINTIPIALNEADYVRMWVQAATTMSTYQAVAGTAAATTPSTDPAPTIQKSDAQTQSSSTIQLSGDNPLGLPQWLQNFLNQLGIGDTQIAHDPKLDYWFDTDISNFLQNFGINWNPAAGTVNGATYDSYADPSQAIYYVVRALEVFEDLQQFGTDLVTNPVGAFQYLVSLELFDWPFHLEEIGVFLSQNPLLLAAVASPAIAPVGVGAVGLAGLAAIPPPTAAPAPVPAPPPVLPVAGMAPTVSGAAGVAPGTSPSSSPAATTTTVANPAPPTPPPAAGGAAFAPPYAVAPPGIGTGSGMRVGAKAQEPTSRGAAKAPEVAAAAAAASGRTRQRRRRRAQQRGYGDEFADMNIDVDPDWGEPVASTVASDQGAGPLGFAGTLSKRSAQAAGLATLSDDEFDRGPSMPMLPGTWNPEAPNGDHK
jgi:PPE-repeat protein